MHKQVLKYYKPEQYLAIEKTDKYKSEYCHGKIFALAGGSANHNQIIILMFEGC